MNVFEATYFFKSLLPVSNKNSEIRIYKKFIGVLTGIKNINFSKGQHQLIEQLLDDLKLKSNPENKRKYYNKKYCELVNYLQTKFSLVTEGYYTSIGLSLGLSFGAGIGIIFGTSFGKGAGISIGLSIGAGLGMVFGMLIGSVKDANAKKEGKVLITRID